MRFGKLTIHNIASIEDAVIDFAEGVLAHESLFLISGETGAGKSTILDSICLALYNNTPRMNASKSGAYSLLADDNIQIDDPRQLLRRGTGEGCVEFDFTGSDGLNYTAKWSINRAHGSAERRLQKIRRELVCHDTHTTLDKQSTIKTEIETKAVRLTFDQFCRTVMLAQGQFSQFLLGDKDEKEKVLELLTDTSIYTKIGQYIFKAAQQAKEKCSLAQAEMQGIVLLSDEQRQDLQQKIALQVKEQQHTTERRSELEKQIKWLSDVNEQEQLKHKAQQQVNEAQHRLESGDCQRLKQTVNQWSETTQARADVIELPKAKEALDRATHQIQLLDDNYERLCAAIAHEAEQQQQRKKQMELIESDLKRLQPKQHIYEQSALIVAKLKDHAQAAEELDKNLKRKDEHELKQHQLKKALAQSEQALKQAQEQLEAKRIELEVKKEELRRLNPDQLEAERKSLMKRQTALQEAEKMRALYEEKKTQKEAAQTELDATQNELKAVELQLNPLAQKAEETHAVRRAAQENYDKIQLSVADWAHKARKKLKVGDNCPVCGKKIDHLLDSLEFDSLTEPFEQKLKLAQEQEREAQVQLQTAQREKERLSKQVETKQQNLSKVVTACQQQHNALKKLTQQLEVEGNANLDQWIIQQLTQCQQQMENLDNLLTVVRDLRNLIDSLQKQYDQSQTNLNRATDNLRQAEKKIADCLAEISRVEALINQQRQDQTKLIGQVDQIWGNEQWKGDWKANAMEFVAQLQHDTRHYQHLLEQQAKLKTEVDQKSQMLQRIHDTAQVREVNGDTPITPIEGLESAWNTHHTQVAAAQQQLKQAQQHLHDVQRRIEEFLNAHEGINQQRLEELAAISSSDIQKMSGQIEALVAERDKVQGALNTHTQRLAELQTLRPQQLPEQPDVERLKADRLECDDAIRLSSESLGQWRAQLQADDEARKRLGNIQQRVNKLQDVADHWNFLNNHLGGDGGKKFRTIAQSFIMGDLLHKANAFMRKFNDRYTLTCQHDSLTILLKDEITGGESSVNTFSGGEGFMAALSLALALSQMNAGRIDVDTIFIDEGFGSLSSNYLERVMTTLRTLRELGGRRVGIISHVEALKESIATRIHVERTQGGSLSRVAIVQ